MNIKDIIDPFRDSLPLSEDHPVIQYLDWQIRKYYDALKDYQLIISD